MLKRKRKAKMLIYGHIVCTFCTRGTPLEWKHDGEFKPILPEYCPQCYEKFVVKKIGD